MIKTARKIRHLLKNKCLAAMFFCILVTVLLDLKFGYISRSLDMLDDDIGDSFTDEKFSLKILREDVTDCLINFNDKDEDIDASKKGHSLNFNEIFSNDGSNEKQTILHVLTSFTDLLSLLKVTAVIIEPSVLHCMLLPKYQELLKKRNFNISDFLGSKNVMTYGIMEKDVTILQQEKSIYKFFLSGFKVHFSQVPLTKWMLTKSSDSKFNTFSSHIFYKYKIYTIHLVVFYKRNNYLWHAALDKSDDQSHVPEVKLLFTNHNGAHEKFLYVSLEKNLLPIADFYVPTNIHYFLLEMTSSRFLECNSSKLTAVPSVNHPESHPYMSDKRFKRNTRIVIRELKKIFYPQLMHLWIWSGTLLGWYRQCDVIPYTTDVDLASWASDVDDLNQILSTLQNNKHVRIRWRMGLLEEGLEVQLFCHGLQTDIFFMYRIQNGSWYSGHNRNHQYYFRYYFPPFTLCSAELLGEKVQVPCETEDVISTEYGPQWHEPVSYWNYETSPKNRGPNIYWEKEKLKYIYHRY